MSGERQLIRGSIAAVLAAALSVVCAAAAPTGAPYAYAQTAIGDCTAGSNWGTERADYANRVVELVNAHRASLNLRALVVTSPLAASAV